MTTHERAIALTKLNVHTIFGEKDAAKRLANISDLWVPSNEVLLVDAMGVFKSHEAISSLVEKIQSLGGPDDQFYELGDVNTLKHDEEDDIWVTKLTWSIGPKGGEKGLTGFDVLTIVGGKIKTCYTFIDPQ